MDFYQPAKTDSRSAMALLPVAAKLVERYAGHPFTICLTLVSRFLKQLKATWLIKATLICILTTFSILGMPIPLLR